MKRFYLSALFASCNKILSGYIMAERYEVYHGNKVILFIC